MKIPEANNAKIPMVNPTGPVKAVKPILSHFNNPPAFAMDGKSFPSPVAVLPKKPMKKPPATNNGPIAAANAAITTNCDFSMFRHPRHFIYQAIKQICRFYQIWA